IYGVHEHRCGVLGKTLRLTASQPIHLCRRATEALHAVCSGYCHEYLAGIRRSDPCHLGGERLSARPGLRVAVALDVGARVARGFDEALAGAGKIRAEWCLGHGPSAALRDTASWRAIFFLAKTELLGRRRVHGALRHREGLG